METRPLDHAKSDQSRVITQAVRRTADHLGLTNTVLAQILGVSEATVSRMGAGTYRLRVGDKPFELAVLLVRLYRSLDTIVSGDDEASRAWLRADNSALGEQPLALIQTISGLTNVIGYLDARRAVG